MILLASSCDEMPVPVHFTLPSGTRGIFCIVVDPGKGEKIFPFEDGRFEISIPGDKPLSIQSDQPFQHYYRIYAKYEDGAELPVAQTPHMFPPGTVALYGPYIEESTNQKVYWFFVGTEEEVTSARRAMKEKQAKEVAPSS